MREVAGPAHRIQVKCPASSLRDAEFLVLRSSIRSQGPHQHRDRGNDAPGDDTDRFWFVGVREHQLRREHDGSESDGPAGGRQDDEPAEGHLHCAAERGHDIERRKANDTTEEERPVLDVRPIGDPRPEPLESLPRSAGERRLGPSPAEEDESLRRHAAHRHERDEQWQQCGRRDGGNANQPRLDWRKRKQARRRGDDHDEDAQRQRGGCDVRHGKLVVVSGDARDGSDTAHTRRMDNDYRRVRTEAQRGRRCVPTPLRALR